VDVRGKICSFRANRIRIRIAAPSAKNDVMLSPNVWRHYSRIGGR
jgi:hypothetical protein